MRLVLLGAPGAGKGTAAKWLTEHEGVVQVSTGDILRSAVQAGTKLGRAAKSYMDRGELVPDELILGIMEQRLQSEECRRGFLLDGFPRTLAQARALKATLARLGSALDLAVDLEVPRELILDRLTTRRTCSNPACQAIYNVKRSPPRVEGRCDRCGSALIQRPDETEEAIDKRLAVYAEKTAPLIDYYRNEGLLLEVDATSNDTVVNAIRRRLGRT